MISDRTGSTPSRLPLPDRADQARALGAHAVATACDAAANSSSFAVARPGVDVLLRLRDPLLRARGRAGDVEREGVVEDEEVPPRALVAALEDAADDARR